MTTPRLFVCTFCTLVTAIHVSYSNPLGGTVVPGSGAASFSAAPGALTINQTTPKVIINWQDFSVGAGEVTRFVQPSSSAAALNRVISDNPSQIFGTLQGNGAVYLINQNGILVGGSGQINVGSFIGSTLDFGPDADSANASFLAGAGLRLSGNSTAAVRNEGYISALDDVFLVAHTVQNAGSISGHTVGLAAGADVELRHAGSERISVVAGNTKAAPGAGDGVVNSGNIAAVSAELKAAGGNIYALAINNGGAIRATGIVKENGRILLRSDRGTVVNSGTLDASSRGTGTKGGDVQVLGQKVGLTGNSKIDVSGDAGGGTVLVGGDLQGKNPNVPNAQRTVVGRNATINADALSSGSGGKVIVWSDEATKYLGSISAKGAGNRGSGGFVEVSGKSSLAFDGAVDVAAARGGAKGTVLLDPATITIQAASPDINGADPGTSDITTLTDLDDASGDFPGADSIITAGAVNALLTGNNNLVLAASVRTTVNAAIDGSDNASLTLNAPRVDLNAPITLAGSGVLSGTPTTVNVGAGGRIQNGIDVAAPAGATVNVAPGTYAENISVAKGLRLAGAKAGVDARTRNTASGESVISGQVRLEAPNITLDGFTVRDSAAGAGIVANNAAGDQIINNYITANVFGLSLASDGSSDILVRNNFFEDNTLPGGASGNGIYTDFTVSRVRVRDNRFEGHPEGSVTFLGTAASTISDIDIIGNLITGDGPISIGNVSGVRITGNSVTANSGHAIWVGGGAANVSIIQNLLHDNGGAGLKFARPGSSGIAAVSSGFTVRENSFQNNADGALVIDTSEGSRYSGILNASGNWWGNDRGPKVDSVGFAGSGNDIAAIHITDLAMATERVDFSPWLNSGVNTSPLGFLGDLTVLNVSPLSPKATADGFIAEALTAPFNLTQRLQLFGGTYADQAVINIPNTVAVVIKEDVILNAATSVSFGSTVNGDGTARNLDIITPTLTLGGAVGTAGANSELGRLTASGSTAINGGAVETAANQNYNGPVTLGADTTLNNTTVAFGSAVNGAGHDLTLNSSGAVILNGPAIVNVDTFRTTGPGLTTLNGGALSANTIDIGDQLVLGADTLLSAGNVTLAGVTGPGLDLTVNASGATIFNGAVSGVNALTTDASGNTVINQAVSVGSVTFNDSVALNGGLITTAFDQFYNEPVTLGADTTLVGVNVTLGSTVTGAGRDLTVNASGVTTFGGPVAGVDALFTDAAGNTVVNQAVSAGSVTLNDEAALNGGSIATTADQNYNASVTLGVDTTLSGANITLADVGGSGRDLTVNASGTTTFDGAVSGVEALTTDAPGNTVINQAVTAGSVTLNDPAALNGAAIVTLADQNYNATVTLGVDTLLAGANVTIAGITGAGRDLNVIAFGATTFNGVVDGVDALTTDAAGNTVIDQAVNATSVTLNDAATLRGGSITTAADQNYNAAVALGADTTLSGVNVTFASSVTGAGQDLAVNASGTTTFNGVVNGVDALTTDAAGNTVINQAVSAGSVTLNDLAALNGATITTLGNQNYNAAVTLGVDTTLSGVNVTLAGITGNNRDLNVNASAATTFNGVVNAVNALTTDAPGNTIVNQAINATSVTLNDPAALNGATITTLANQNYNASVTLGADTTLSGADVTLAGITGGGRNLNVNASGASIFNGIVDGVNALTTDAAGNTVVNQAVNAGSVTFNDTVSLNGSLINTVGNQSYNAAATLGVDTILSGANVRFAGIAGAGRDLTVNASGTTTFDGAVNGVDDLVTDAAGNTVINQGVNAASVTLNDPASLNGGAITTAGNQNYNAAATLGADTILSGANVRLVAIAGGGRDLTVNASGATTFDGAVTGVDALVTDAGGNTVINQAVNAGSLTLNDAATLNGGTITTAGSQTYNAAVTLGANTFLNNTTVAFNSTVAGGNNDLTLNSSGDVTLNGPAIANVRAFRTTGPGSTTLNGGGLSANTLIAIGDELILGDNTTLNSVDVSLSVVDGFGNSLAVNASGVTTFGGAVAGLGTLTTDAAGDTLINTHFIGSFGSQTYNDAVTVGADTTLAGANVTFASTLTGAGNDLTVLSPGTTVFNGTVVGIGGLVTDAGGDTIINSAVNVDSLTLNDAATLNGGVVTTAGDQRYNAAVTLGTGTTLDAGSVRLGATLDGGGNDLDVSASGTITFAGTVDNVGTLTLNSGGDITSAALRVGHLLFTSSGRATFINSGNEIVSALSDCAFWSALDGFLVSDSLSAQVFSGILAGSCVSIDNDEAVEKIVSQLVPQVQFDEIQTESVEIRGERLQKAGILTRSSELFVKPGEALTRSGEVNAEKNR
jgi:filamentous hemagglutinin family protein